MASSLVPFPVPVEHSLRYGVFALTDADRPQVLAHYLGLSPQMRRLRFGLALSDERIEAWVREMPLTGRALGYFVWNELRAVVWLAPDESSPQRAELAVTADARQRGHGWGRRLVHQALDAAEAAGLRNVDIYYLRENTPMARIARTLPGKHGSDGCDAHVTVDLQAWAAQALERHQTQPCAIEYEA